MNEWIPCTERTPEENGYYLTTNLYGEVNCDYWKVSNFELPDIVVAWMPLPKPYYKEESHG